MLQQQWKINTQVSSRFVVVVVVVVVVCVCFNYHIGPSPGITGEKRRCKGVRYLYSLPTVPKSSVVGAFREGGRERKRKCCRKGDPFQGPKLGSCLTLGHELSEETHVLTKQEILLGKGTRVESSRVKPGELLCHMARSLRFYSDGISFRVVFGQSS